MTTPDIAGITSPATLEDLHAALAAAGIVPSGGRFMHVEMDITSRCNIRCVMCYHSLDEYARGKAVFFPLEAFEALAAIALPRAHTLTLSLGSEPTTSPHFAGILRAAARHCVPELTFFTNATLLRGELIDVVLDTNVTQICVSIHAATAGTYEAIRRGARFDEVVGNVRALVAARAARGRIHPRLRFD